jgi:hypothetical protein
MGHPQCGSVPDQASGEQDGVIGLEVRQENADPVGEVLGAPVTRRRDVPLVLGDGQELAGGKPPFSHHLERLE